MEAVNLLAAWPEAAAVIPAAERELARPALTAPLLSSSSADLTEALAADSVGAFDFLVLEGIVLKETTLARRAALPSHGLHRPAGARRRGSAHAARGHALGARSPRHGVVGTRRISRRRA